MTNPNNIVQGKHLESLASDTRSYVLARDLEVIQAVQADLDDLTFTLDTTPATVDGGLWRDGNALKMKVGAYAVTFDAINLAPIPTNLPITISGNVVTVNGLRFQLNGFKSNLTAQNGLLFSDGSQCGVIAVNGSDYIFQMTFDALDSDNLRDGDTISITALDEGNVTLIFEESNFFSVGEQKISKPTCKIPTEEYTDAEDGDYVYTPRCKTNYVVQSDNNSYNFFAGDIKEFYVNFSTLGGTATADNVNKINENVDATITAPTEENAKYNVDVKINSALFGESFTPDTGFTAYFWPVGAEDATTDYTYTYEVYEMDGDEKSTLMSTEVGESFETQDGGGYTYTAAGTSDGYYAGEDTYEYLLQWREKKLDNNGFTITGLVDGLNVYDGNIYNATAEALKEADADEDGTLSEEELKKANLTSYGTITASGTTGTVTITKLDAIKPNGTGYESVQVIDKTGDKPIFRLAFGGELSSVPTPIPATFTENTTKNLYEYVGTGTNQYFSIKETGRESTGKFTTSTYYGASMADVSFAIDGLKATGFTGMSVTEDGYIVRGVQTLGSVDENEKVVYVWAPLLPDNPTVSTIISIVDGEGTSYGEDNGYKVRLGVEDVNTRALRSQNVDALFTDTASNTQDYNYRAEGRTAGFYNNYNGGISFRMNDGAETFSITRLSNGLAGYVTDIIGTGKPIELIDAGNNLTYVKVSDAALPNGSTTGTRGDIVLSDSTYSTYSELASGYGDGKLFALMLDSSVPQLDANNQPATVAAASLTFDSVAGTATYTGTTYDEYYFRVPSTLPAAGSTDTYVTTAKYFDHAGGDSFLICGLSFVDGISQQLVDDNISVTETKTLDTLTGEFNVNYNFSIGSALKNNLQSGKYITISSRDTQDFSPTIVTEE